MGCDAPSCPQDQATIGVQRVRGHEAMGRRTAARKFLPVVQQVAVGGGTLPRAMAARIWSSVGSSGMALPWACAYRCGMALSGQDSLQCCSVHRWVIDAVADDVRVQPQAAVQRQALRHSQSWAQSVCRSQRRAGSAGGCTRLHTHATSAPPLERAGLKYCARVGHG